MGIEIITALANAYTAGATLEMTRINRMSAAQAEQYLGLQLTAETNIVKFWQGMTDRAMTFLESGHPQAKP